MYIVSRYDDAKYCIREEMPSNKFYKKKNKVVVFDNNYDARVVCKALNHKVKQNSPTIGTELEFEIGNGENNGHAVQNLRENMPALCTAVKFDCSLINGFELNTVYYPIKYWELRKIREMLTDIQDYKPCNKHRTAGQHVHLFGKDNAKVSRLINDNYQKFLEFIMPISARDKYIRDAFGGANEPAHFGIGGDAFRDNYRWLTLEIRAFAASPDPSVIKDRLVVCDALYKALARYGTWRDIYKHLPQKGAQAYKRLLKNKDNPHCFGADTQTMLAKFN